MRIVNPEQLNSNEWKLYEYIAKHFISTLSPDCLFKKTEINFMIGPEKFKYSGFYKKKLF